MTSRTHVLILAALLAAGLAACGSGESGGADTAGAGAPEAAPKAARVLRTSEGFVLRLQPGCGPVPRELQGAWTYELRAEDIPPEWADARTGPAERIYGPGHRYTSPVNGEGSPAHACVKGDQVHTSEHPDCPGAGNEVLRWRMRGDELTLTPRERPGCFITNIHFGDPPRSRTLRRSGPAAQMDTIPAELVGTWSQRTTRDEPPPEVADIQTGTHQLRLAADGAAALLTPDGGVVELGGAEAHDGRLRLSSEDDGPCQVAWSGEYEYRVSGGELRLTPLTDPCPYSRWQFAVHPWKSGG